MYTVLRMMLGGETWALGEVVECQGVSWQVWTTEYDIEPESALMTYIDIHERDGDPPSVWRAERDGELLAEFDARTMTPEQRAWAPIESVEEGQEILGLMIKEKVDEVIERLEE